MNDISIVYYTANRISDSFAVNVRSHLLQSSGGNVPIISVSQKPIDFGENIWVKGLVPSVYNTYVQVLVGARCVKTQYVACCEDDCLYVPEHFEYRPSNAFSYNTNRWNVDEEGVYFYKHSRLMCMCVCPTKLLVDTLEARFSKYPDPSACIPHLGEPGKYERQLRLPVVKMEEFKTENPCIHFNHRDSLGLRRGLRRRYEIIPRLEYWGNAQELWNKFYV